MKVIDPSGHHDGREQTIRVGNYLDLLEASSLEESLSHCANGATIFGPYVHLSIHNESCDRLAGTSILHARFRWIDDESRADDGVLQSVSHFPFVRLAGSAPGDIC